MHRSKSAYKNSHKSRRIMIIKPSKYETAEAIQANRKYWGKVFDKLDTPAVAQEEDQLQNRDVESAYLAEILPEKLYRKVCKTLDLPLKKNISNDETEAPVEEKRHSRIMKEPVLYLRKTIRIDREIESDTEVEVSPRLAEDEVNVHWELLKKPEREQVTWPTHYLQPEREEEKTLVRKADDLTDRIVHEFCEYMTQLGGNQQSQLFKPKAIKELFQIEFDTHVARSLQVIPKELPSVEEKIAEVTGNPELSQYAVLEREVTRDIKAERRPDILEAFGRSLPHREQRHAPQNHTKSMWRSARHVPKDLVSLKTVWEGITNLRSVKEYCRWMIDHPEYKRAPYLSSLGMFDSAVLEARLTLESLQRMATPVVDNNSPSSNVSAPIEHIRRRLSQLADME
ncbi:uncharacterized protein LOC125228953 [Leguminivora glycinivorella]|uniref:uncharacterized protein LOC125228953 n=1 Tax=Leguminivora glycinivorella TaxID=1035111 RepID=UPI00200E7597|nr:uncharacterized protein LOC125228953 [Leguminivora glycinivorella]